MEKKYIIGIDLGGMSAKGGLFSEDGQLLGEEKIGTHVTDGFEGTLQKLAILYNRLVSKNDIDSSCVLAIGVG
ncbi:MAG: ROK family protein, partial [Clostridia bacterium]|nr:ROK family protein [Clostridia bacterium]